MVSTVRGALWSAQAQMRSIAGRQIVITEGRGSYLITEDGRRLFDAPAGLWYAAIGHGNEEMAEVAAAQTAKLETYHVFGRFVNDRAIELSDKLASMSPVPDPKVILTSGGSDANEYALKLARRYWQLVGRGEKTFVLSRDHSYHGLHTFGTSITGLQWNREGYGTESFVPDTELISHDDLGAVERAINAIGAERIAAIIAEPIIGSGGVIPPAPGYLEGLQRLARENDILFIVDEVITGFGRTGRMFACERWGLTPDILTFAKGVSSGYAPVGGLYVAPRIWNPFFEDDPSAPIYRHGVTYSGHAVGAALSLKNLEIIEREGLPERAAELERLLAAELAPLSDHEQVREVRVGGFAAGVELHDPQLLVQATDACIERGVISRALGTSTMHFSPPLITTDDEVRVVAATVREALDALPPPRTP